MPSSNKPHSKSTTRVSKSGRIIKTPKAIQTTSSEDAPRPRSSKKLVSVQNELQRLRGIAKKFAKPKTAEPEKTAAAVIEDFEDVLHDDNPEQITAISTDSRQVDAKDAKKSNNGATQQTSGMRKEKAEKVSVVVSCTARPNNRGRISPMPPRKNSINEPNTEEGRVSPHENFEEHRPKSPKVDSDVTKSLRDIVQQNKNIQEQYENITKQNEKIIEQQKKILEQFGTRNIDQEMSQKLYEPLEGFPLKTVEQFRELESESSRKDRKKLYTFLCHLGGTTPKDFLKCAFKHLMDDELVASFSWPGGKDSEKFGDTKVANVLYLAARKCPLFRGPETVAEFKTDMLDLLRTTKQRYRNFVKRSVLPTENEKNSDLDEDELDEEDEEQLLKKIERLEERANLQLPDDEDFDADYDTD